MFTKRLLRFSIGAMLVLMAGVAVLLSREVQRAKAIEQTINQIEEWNGKVLLTPRESMLNSSATMLPKYWTERIFSVDVALYTSDDLEMSRLRPYRVVKPDEIARLLELGALGDVIFIQLQGSAIKYTHVSYLCKSSLIKRCTLIEVRLSDSELVELRTLYPNCEFIVVR